MVRIIAGIFFLAGPWLVYAAQRDSFVGHDRPGLDGFIRSYADQPASPPFSFTYDEKLSTGFLARWTVTSDTRSEDGRTTKTVTYADPATGLRVTAAYTLYPDFPAVEWVIRFRNTGKA